MSTSAQGATLHSRNGIQNCNTCIILHNMCIDNNVPEPDDDENIDFDFGIYAAHENIIDEIGVRVNPDLVAGRQLQREIIRVHSSN
ncbi:hypothetical protein NQ314_006413 [Rhamnusium bicolor]|uniref:Uncharacterized protein n=1 Tax=Rhamnusium bicolor TaxID=1586634 RepID=A0AAV8Z2S7_9CUCU|nr:hypothetical protein NQ314_006413 [Rhamnusium bicolor]